MSDWIKILAEEDYAQNEYVDVFCPNCLWNPEPDEGEDPDAKFWILNFGPAGSLEDPPDAASWIEKWRCPECGTVFQFKNANY